MAPFTRKQLDRLDWSLFQNGSVNMYWRKSFLDEDCAWLAEHGYRVCQTDSAKWPSVAEALRELGVVLEFPDYYGCNLDAFNDCVSDLDVPEHGGVAVVFYRYDRFATSDPKSAHTILDILATNSRRFMLFGQRLVTLVQTDDPRLTFRQVGATSVHWNRREWTTASRQP